MEEENNIKELEKFVLDNPELEKLKNLLDEFNIFEVLNIVNAEIRHSIVLAWLLNPLETHCLGSYFLKLFLKNFAFNSLPNPKINLFEVEFLNLNNVEIRREWNHIDILILIKDNDKKIVIAIENKIKTSEHGNQLERYREAIRSSFKNFEKLYIYLTPDGLIPTDDNWSVCQYDMVAEIIEKTLETKKDILNSKVYEFIYQYTISLRRHIVGNSEIEEICKKIYEKHSKALDLIFQHKPDINLDLSKHIQNIINSSKIFILDSAGKTLVRFTSNIIDEKITKEGEGWSKSKRIILYEITISDNEVILRLYIGPGNNILREEIHEFAKKNKRIFNKADRNLGKKYLAIYQVKFVTKKDFNENTSEELMKIIDKKWSATEPDLLEIDRLFKEWDV